MTDLRRRPWSEEEDNVLIDLWDTVGSIVLISLMLDRSPSSVQTQASRKGLPRRIEEKGRHRRRWTGDDEGLLDSLVAELTDGEGKIPIDVLAERMDRSIDAIVARLADRFGSTQALLDRIRLPRREPPREERRRAEDKARQAPQGGAQARTRKCLCCGKPFWSEGPHIRICNKCKRNYDDYNWDW